MTNTRTQIFEQVSAEPGTHFRGLMRSTGIASSGMMRHHLDALLRADKVIEVKDGKFSRFYPVNEWWTRELAQRHAMKARPVVRRIIQLLLQRPCTSSELQASLGVAYSTLGYHLTLMRQRGIVERAFRQYRLVQS